MTLGEKIKNARKECALSQEQLAEKLCVSRSAIAKWETDKGIPDIENLKALSGVFEVSIDYLVGNENDFRSKQHKMEAEEIFQEDHIIKRNKRYREIIGKKCTIEMTNWNDGICEAYVVAPTQCITLAVLLLLHNDIGCALVCLLGAKLLRLCLWCKCSTRK
jgi:transcriptional regulator with XRE-family HTH domain